MRRKNLFIFDTRQSATSKATLVKEKDRPTYLISKNSQIRLWHRRLGHTSNARSYLIYDIEVRGKANWIGNEKEESLCP